MALVKDVIYHEGGHGLDDFTGPGSRFGGGMTDSAFSEAIGDIVTMLIAHDENIDGATCHDRTARLFFTHFLEAETYLQSYKIVQRVAEEIITRRLATVIL
jgi:hypothetical protein